MNEIELKLLVDRRQERLLRHGAAVRRVAAGRARTRTLLSVYHDTEDGALKNAGIALRLRRDGRRWIQTVKKSSGAIAQGLSTPIEDECLLPGPRIDLSRIKDAELRAEVEALAAPGLKPTVETEFRRTDRMLNGPGGARVELAIDVGEVRANGAAAPFAEAELEVKEGPQGALFVLARELITEGPVRFSNRSKAERAGRLRDGGRAIDPVEPVKSSPVRIDPGTRVEDAAVAVLNEMQHQVATNLVATVETGSPEGPHQLRVGLRRLRSALAAFRPALGCDELERLRDCARALGRTAGRIRDLDVFADEMLPAAMRDAPEEPGFERLAGAVSVRREAVGREVRAALAGAEAAGFVLDLAGFVATRGWRAGGADARAHEAKIDRLARKALDKHWKTLTKRADDIDDLSTDERHEMRKEIKKLRYVLELFRGLCPKDEFKPFRKALKTLQDDFGAMNDAKMAQELLSGGGAPGAGDPDMQRAAGRLLGAALAGAGHLWPKAVEDWRALAKLGPCWR